MEDARDFCWCCKYLRTVPCSDTKDHRHFICRKVNIPIANYRVQSYCSNKDKYKECINFE